MTNKLNVTFSAAINLKGFVVTLTQNKLTYTVTLCLELAKTTVVELEIKQQHTFMSRIDCHYGEPRVVSDMTGFLF